MKHFKNVFWGKIPGRGRVGNPSIFPAPIFRRKKSDFPRFWKKPVLMNLLEKGEFVRMKGMGPTGESLYEERWGAFTSSPILSPFSFHFNARKNAS